MANMSHELRTPLNAIIGFSEVMENEGLGPLAPRYRSYAGDIRASGYHLLALVNDVLDLEKALSGRAALMEAPLELHQEVLRPSLRLAADTAARHGVTIDLRSAGAEVCVNADARKLVQIVTNLLTNAAKYSEAGSRVELRPAIAESGEVQILVRDQGIGMTEDETARALEPFTQVGDRRDRHQGGTGLGLPLAVELTRRHGGRLEIDSTPGRGTTVTVTLPPERRLSA
jgi:two-component system cell cycle sensor histidine kinase PleC